MFTTKLRCIAYVVIFLPFLLVSQFAVAQVTGSLQKWAPLTVEVAGPFSIETDTNPNPFLDYRLTVRFVAPSGNVHVVPGFFAGNGQGGSAGTSWQARFAADEVGQWRYSASMRSGNNVSISNEEDAGNAFNLNDAEGQFTITPQSSDAPGFLRYGRLEYTGEHYLKFRDGPYWIKAGTDSPENFLGYAGFDGTVDHGGSQFLHDYVTHRGDARDDDPFFSNPATGVDSLGITGALNYLSDQGVNSIYFLPMNLGGDGQETFPFIGGTNSVNNKTHYDLSKLHQWNQTLNHAQRRGIALNIVLSETEPGNERWFDNGELGIERKLFFRELIARFGYLLAAKWNLAEENDFPVSEIRKHASYIAELDWTDKPISVHTQINNFRDYELILGDELFSASSIQYDPARANAFVETWRTRTSNAGRKWVIDMDENTGGVSDVNFNTRRKQILYDVLFSGGNIEWYFGLHALPLGGDITAGDFRQREETWKTMRFARNFMEKELPFWRMEPADELVRGAADAFGGAQVFAAVGEVYAVYLPQATGSPTIDLRNTSGNYTQQWFNPRNGSFEGDQQTLVGGQQADLGTPPSARNDDWVILIRSENAPALEDFGADVTSPTSAPAEPASTTDDTTEPDTSPNSNTDDSSTSDTSNSDTDDNPILDDATTNDSNTDNPNTDDQGTDDQGTDDQSTDNQSTEDQSTGDQQGDNESSSNNDADNNLDAAIASENEPPTFTELQDIPAAIAGSLYKLNITATDAEGTAPVLTAETLPAGMTINNIAAGAVELVWQVPADATEPVNFELLAIDTADRNLITRLPVTIQVALETTPDANLNNTQPITSSTSAFLFGTAGSTATTTLLADDATGDSTDISATNTAGNSTNNSTNNSTSGDQAPVIFGLENAQLRAGSTYRNTILPIDPEGFVASLRASSLPRASTFNDTGTGTREFVWTPSTDDVGTHELTIIATDTGATPHVVQQTVTLTVVGIDSGDAVDPGNSNNDANINYAPVFFPLGPQQVSVGDRLSLLVRPVDPNGVPPILHMTAPPLDASFNDNGDGTRTFVWLATEEHVGSVDLTFLATDSEDVSIVVEEIVRVEVLAR